MRIIIYLLVLTAFWQSASAETILVSEDLASDPLIDAIEAAAAGDTIRVAAGEYTAGISIEKPLTLIGAGADRTRVYAPFGVFSIKAIGVTIEGFHLSGNLHGRSLTTSVSCHSCSATLRHNIIDGDHFAVSVLGNSKLRVNYNELRGNVGIKSLDNPNTIDARFNWWGTESQKEIQTKIASHKKSLVDASSHLTENTRSLVINHKNEER